MTTSSIRTVLRLKGLFDSLDDQMHGAQHVGKHMVWFYFEVVRFEFNGYMAVAEVVGGANQIVGRSMLRAVRDFEHGLGRRRHSHQRAVFQHKHVATAHHGAARQKNTEGTSQGVGGVETAFLSNIPVQFNAGGPPD